MKHVTACLHPVFRNGTRALVLLLFPLMIASPVRAEEFNARGRDFWVTFMTNNGNTPVSDLRLYAASDVPTRVTVTYTLTGKSVVVPLPQANTTVEIDINTMFQTDAQLVPQDAGVTKKSFHVTAENDITLYGVNVNTKSADAFLGLPLQVLTLHYFVLAYTNGFNGTTYDQASEFAVISADDGNTVTITPPKGLLLQGRRDDQPFTVTLNRGDVYYGQAQLDKPQDASGTELASTKQIAVFAGSSRTCVPTSVGNYRDHLCEQMPPVEGWGMAAIVPPLFNITPASQYKAEVRVLASGDNTNWTLNGVRQPTLQRGTIGIATITNQPLIIQADKPILTCQYEHSVGLDDPNNPGQPALGDPFSMLAPPAEQFDTSYAFQSITHPEFLKHYINVVAPTQSVGSLMLDGAPLNQRFLPINGTSLSYAQIEVQGGAHYIRCDVPMGLYVYGYGRANSYGYLGGMLFGRAPSTGVSDGEAADRTSRGVSISDAVPDGSVLRVTVTTDRLRRVRLVLLDVLGKQIRTVLNGGVIIEGNTALRIPSDELPAGVYWLSLHGDDGAVTSRKIIIAR